MKTAISVPDDLFAQADALARREGRSRSEVYSSALREYVARHTDEDLTQAINQAVAGLGDEPGADPLVAAAAASALRDVDW
jgi:metal-responsive CopG/Arc/MetJ family transcriptional regulator